MSEKLNNVLPDLDAELKQMAAETRVAGMFLADAQVVEAGIGEHLANLVDGAVGVSGEEDGSASC